MIYFTQKSSSETIDKILKNLGLLVISILLIWFCLIFGEWVIGAISVSWKQALILVLLVQALIYFDLSRKISQKGVHPKRQLAVVIRDEK